MASKVILEVVEGPLKGKTFELKGCAKATFGRGPDCSHRLDVQDRRISRCHFLIESDPPLVRLRDLGSRNGTIVNDVLYRTGESTVSRVSGLATVDLRDGDRIRVGSLAFAICIHLASKDRRQKALDTCARCGRDVSVPLHELGRQPLCPSCEPTLGHPIARDAEQVLEQVRTRPEWRPFRERYAIGPRVGRGAMGVVYRANRLDKKGEVAIKLVRVGGDERSRRWFLRECVIIAAMKHERIVEFHDMDVLGDIFYIAMEFCRGGSLDDLLRRGRRPVPPGAAGSMAMDVLQGLAFMHARGFVHRDIKPSNILFTESKGGAIRIGDFGLARKMDEGGLLGHSLTDSPVGTLQYMPKEMVANYREVQPASDVYSVGTTLYQMLTGELPRDFKEGSDPLQVILFQESTPIRQRNKSIPDGLAVVVDRSLSTLASKRYKDAEQFRRALEKALQSVL